MKNTLEKKIALLTALSELLETVDRSIDYAKSQIEDDFMVEKYEKEIEAYEKIKAHLEKLI